MSPITLAVVVCAYTIQRWDGLRAAVASAVSQEPAPEQLWVVIDHNIELEERARQELISMNPCIRVIPNTRRRGLSGARNTALDHIDTDVVAFLDDDAVADPKWLARLAAEYDNPDVMGVGGAAAPRWPERATRPVTLPCSGDGSGRGELDWVVGCTYRGQPERRASVRNLMGCNMSFRREVFDVVGGFSEDMGRIGTIPLGCEETELCIRAATAMPDGCIIFEPQAMVRHHVSADRLTWQYLRRRGHAEGLSKAAVSSRVGSAHALATERSYATAVLPKAVMRELARALRPAAAHRRRGLAGAGAIVLALAATGFGYLQGRLRRIAPASIVPVRPTTAVRASASSAEADGSRDSAYLAGLVAA
jgi:GT2 family glycosyltransferase